MVLCGVLGLLAFVRWPRFASMPLHRGVAGVVSGAMIVALAVQVVPDRRYFLSASLAGAGDTVSIARWLATVVSSGGTVHTFEGDGTANLYAYARVPVTTVLKASDVRKTGGVGVDGLEDLNLMRLDDPVVAAQLAHLNIEYFAIGTTSIYWSPAEAYSWELLLAQPQLRLAEQGTDMVVLRYVPGP
jgi:hypothetical protein